jgi:hypothetical protein
MDLAKTLAELRTEKMRIEEAILALERLAGGTPLRGRPPKWMTAITALDGEDPPKKKARRKPRNSSRT